MSRGFGAVQRALLAAVEETWTDLRPELWLCVTTVDLGLGEHRESRRRAAHRLAAAQRIEVCTAEVRVPSRTAIEGVAWRALLFARLPMGAASEAYAKELRDEFRETQVAMWNAEVGGPEYERLYQWILWYQGPNRRNDDVYDIDGETPSNTGPAVTRPHRQ